MLNWNMVEPLFCNTGIQNVYGAQNAYAADTMRNRLEAAKLALHRPESVERLPNGRGWRWKPSGQMDLYLLANFHSRPVPAKRHDLPRIRRSIAWGGWICSSSMAFGSGHTPHWAYRDWLRMCEERHDSKSD